MSRSHVFCTSAIRHATYLFYYRYFFFYWCCCAFDASVVIDFTCFCHGLASNLRRNMEALNFSPPTRRHNGKAGGKAGVGEGLRCRNDHLHSLPPSCWSDNMLSLLLLYWSWKKKKENTNFGINSFSSVQSLIWSVRENSIIFTDMNLNESLTKENGVLSHLSPSTRLFCNSYAPNKLHPLQFHTESDSWNYWSETEKWSISS